MQAPTTTPSTRWLMLALMSTLAACSRPDGTPPAAATPSPAAAAHAALPTAAPAAPGAAATGEEPAGIAWVQAASDADVDAAFARARRRDQPLFVYWGAKWCPPCNQVKATLFNRQDFIQRSRAFVPVYVDGDSLGAQKLGSRFKVRGYPTMVLFSPQGEELTRLPGEVDAEQYTQVLTLGMNARRPVKAVLADVQAGGDRAAALSANDWKLLAYYSWETDQQQLVRAQGLPALLQQLAAACPPDQEHSAMRLRLKAAAAGGDQVGGAAKSAPPAAPPLSPQALQALLASPAQARQHMDVLTNQASELVAALTAPGSAPRTALAQAVELSMVRFEADTTLSRADRITATLARVDLARLMAGKGKAAPLPASLLADVRAQAARLDRETTDGYERQAVITAAAHVLGQAGLLAESDTLLKANLDKSHSPYYLMSGLARNARQRGDTAEALRWYERAFARSEGPATRLQWGASLAVALLELAPDDEKRIEALVSQLFDEAAAQPDSFYERSARDLRKVGSRVAAWGEIGRHEPAYQRLQRHLSGACQRLPAADPQRTTCEGLLTPGSAQPS